MCIYIIQGVTERPQKKIVIIVNDITKIIKIVWLISNLRNINYLIIHYVKKFSKRIF